MTDDQSLSRLADHLLRYEFRKRDDNLRILANAQIGVAAAAYMVKLAARLGQDDLADELNLELNQHLNQLDADRKQLAIEFDGTGLGDVDRWYDTDTGEA